MARLANAILGLLGGDPLDQFLQAVFQSQAGAVAEQITGLADIGEAVADITAAGLLENLGHQIFPPHCLSKQSGDLEDAVTTATADVDRLAHRRRRFHGQTEGTRHVSDMDEVTALLPILEDGGRLAVEEGAAEDREHTGIGVGELLTGAEDIEQPERHALHAIGGAKHQGEALLHVLRKGIDRRQIRLLVFVRWQRLQGLLPVLRLPVAGLQIRRPPARRGDKGSVGTAVKAFAIDAHGGGNHDSPDRLLHDLLHQYGGPEIVGAHLALDPVPAMADTHFSGQIEDPVDTCEGTPNARRVPEIPFDEVDVSAEIDGRARHMDLLYQAVEHPHLVPLASQLLTEMSSDEAGTARNQVKSHPRSPAFPRGLHLLQPRKPNGGSSRLVPGVEEEAAATPGRSPHQAGSGSPSKCEDLAGRSGARIERMIR